MKKVNYEKLKNYETYEIIIEPCQDGWFSVTILDIPEIITGGRTQQEALKNAQEAINLTLMYVKRMVFLFLNLKSFAKEKLHK